MSITRRQMSVSLAALAGLAGCGGLPDLRSGGVAPAAEPAMRAVPNTGYEAWVASFRGRAAGAGIPQSTLAAAFRDAGYLPDVIERDRNQTEFTRTLEDYLAIAASDERVTTGRAKFARHADTLARIESTYGVEPRIVTAIWGLESRYGQRMGDVPVVSALSTLAYDGRRGAFFEKQLLAALRILANGDITPARMTGSWAGAMGHTQFIPTSYQAYAVDFTGDGRRDIWSEDPSDALASTAAYLSRSGWQRGQPWGVEVTLPGDFPAGMLGRGTTRSASDWAAMGVRAAGGGTVGDHGPASIIRPQTPGPAFMVFRNFTVITRYNNAEKYVIGVGHLSDRIAGGAPVRASFGPDAYGLTLEDRMALQRGLTRAGFDAGGADGVLGSKTEAAIRAYQRANGLAETGEPSRGLLQRLA
ncbi:lytic murein transglycosylase [Aquicoccus sp. SCR17]|nr:lytic murein transglycosylase [Carideicomes alvinocaridis]